MHALKEKRVAQYFTSIVKLYSTSLFNYALENKILDKISKDFAKLAEIFSANPSVLKKAAAPIYSEIDQQQIMQKEISALKCAKETINFISTLAKNKRLALLDKITDHFNLLYKSHLGKKNVEVISSYVMSEKEILELQKKLEKIYAAEIDLVMKIDPNIIGGLVIKHDNKMYDGSLKTKFENLTHKVYEEIALL